jgi:ADP-heptose:LPS heptosyltransferase
LRPGAGGKRVLVVRSSLVPAIIPSNERRPSLLITDRKLAKPFPRPSGLERFQDALQALPAGAEAEVWIRVPCQLGDMIMALPSLFIVKHTWEALARAQGRRLRFVVTGKRSASLFQESVPEVFAACHLDDAFPPSGSPLGLLRHWGRNKPLAVINYSKSDRLKTAAWLARVPVRAGIADGANNWCYHYSHPFITYAHVGHRHFRLLPLTEWLAGPDAVGRMEAMGSARFGGASVLDALRGQGWDGGPYAVFGVYPLPQFPERCWYPLDEPWLRLAELARRDGVTPVLAGGSESRERLERIAAQGRCLSMAGRTTLPQLLALLDHAVGTISVDTGIAHLAAATGRPTVVIFAHGQEYWDFPCGPKVLSLRGNPAGDPAYPVPADLMGQALRPWAAATAGIPAARAWGLLKYLASERAEA